MTEGKIVLEGKAKIQPTADAFYNPAQVINRDLSVLVMNEHKGKTILDALSATGLRAIRYYKELENVHVCANDVDDNAILAIKRHLELNNIEEYKNYDKVRDVLKEYEIDANIPENSTTGIEIMHQDASKLTKQFDIIDLDPYGTASPFIDSAVKNVKKGGLLCITCTDMQTLGGAKNQEANFMKYGSTASNSDFCHEHALRMVIKAVQDSASRCKKTVVPLLSVSIDFYIRIFLRVESSALNAKDSCINSGLVYNCQRCKWFTTQRLATKSAKNKYAAAINEVPQKCIECNNELIISGPVYLGPIQDKAFVSKLIAELNSSETKLQLSTAKRLSGILAAIRDEINAPFYLRMKGLSKIFRAQMPKVLKIRNAIFNAGYHASPSHIGGDCLKTDMPISKVYDIYRFYFKSKENVVQPDTLADTILNKTVDWEVSFEHHPDALVVKEKQARYVKNSNAPLSKPRKRELEDADCPPIKETKLE